MYTQQGRISEAQGLLRAALASSPDYAEAHNNLGVLQARLSLGQRADALVRTTMARAGCIGRTSHLYDKNTSSPASLHAFRTAPAPAPAPRWLAGGWSRAWRRPALTPIPHPDPMPQRDIGQVEEAILSYEECLELDPDNRNAGERSSTLFSPLPALHQARLGSRHALWQQRQPAAAAAAETSSSRNSPPT
jgi:tetratricopeptide (TPR) repeat protein